MISEQLAALYEEFGFQVHQRCLALLGRREDADDVLQEVFLRVQRYPPKDLERSPLPWLYRIASHCCFDWLKARRNREAPASGDAGGGGVADDLRLAQGTAQDADRRALLGAVLRTMDAATQELVVLYYLDGMTQEEVAAEVRLSRRTVIKKLGKFEEEFQKLWSKGRAQSPSRFSI